jgi:hypothetical protein
LKIQKVKLLKPENASVDVFFCNEGLFKVVSSLFIGTVEKEAVGTGDT